MRNAYEELGADAYYRQHGDTYRNPHEAIVHAVIQQALARWQPPLDRALDLACGSGEATLALQASGCTHIDAIDPFTYTAYAERIGRVAEQWTFDDIAAGVLIGRRYTTIICSFALHLAPESRLPALAIQLSLVGATLLVVTPHKRPIISDEWGWTNEGEFVAKRVRARFYRSRNAPETDV